MKELVQYWKEAEKAIGNHDDYTYNQLMLGYCSALDNSDDYLADGYLGGLYLKHLGTINNLYKKHGQILRMTKEDFVDWITDSIQQAASERPWEKNPDKVKNAQQVVMQILKTRHEAGAYGRLNWHKNKAQFGIMSLDNDLSDESESTALDLLESPSLSRDESADYIIQSLINNKKIIEAIIADTISHNDCEKHEKKTEEVYNEETKEYDKIQRCSSQFWPFRVVQLLNSIPEEYESEFKRIYKVDELLLKTGLETIKKSSNSKLYNYIDATRDSFREFLPER